MKVKKTDLELKDSERHGRQDPAQEVMMHVGQLEQWGRAWAKAEKRWLMQEEPEKSCEDEQLRRLRPVDHRGYEGEGAEEA
jgi:hypothetical protein